MGLKPYLQLVRLPNLFTAAADPLAGFLIVGGALAETRAWLPLVLAGVSIYAAGMILNDVFDYDVDRVERPARPLPSGRVSRKLATGLGIAFLLLGLGFAAFGGTRSLIVAVVLSGCVVAYDAGWKRIWLGPEAMGACRSLNLLLGMTLVPTLGGPVGWLAAGVFGLFVVGVTWISRNEMNPGVAPTLRGGLAVQLFSIMGMVAAVIGLRRDATDLGVGFASGMIVLLATATVVIRTGFLALRAPSASTLQAAVKTGVFSLVWLDVSLVASALYTVTVPLPLGSAT